MATYLPSHKPSKISKICWALLKKQEQTHVTLSHAFLHMDTTSVGQPVKNYIHQLYVDIGCHLEGLPKAMAKKDRWQESQRTLFGWVL